jgi:heterodisulfide reductase subunit A-like polyferredoxin
MVEIGLSFFMSSRKRFRYQIKFLSSSKNMHIRHICVIGAGISGLVTAKTFLEEGYDLTLPTDKSGGFQRH